MHIQQLKQRKIFLGFNKDIPIKKSWGQNFIIDDNTIKKIIRIIKPHKDEHIIEIGPGRGALTISLLKKVKKITALEIDPLLTEYLNKKNPIAKYLKDRRYRQIVIKNKKAYNRKKYEQKRIITHD